MKTYNFAEVTDKSTEVLQNATAEPVLLIQHSQPTHVIMSVDRYQRIVDRLEQLEDLVLGEKAVVALSQSSMVGSDDFTAALVDLANGKT